MANRPALSVAEREVLKVLWDHGRGTVREINEVLERQGRQWAYTTVATLLQRLVVKKYAVSDPSAVPHVFRAVVSRDELLDRRLKDAAEELCDGRAAPLVLAWCKATASRPMSWRGCAGCWMRPPVGRAIGQIEIIAEQQQLIGTRFAVAILA